MASSSVRENPTKPLRSLVGRLLAFNSATGLQASGHSSGEKASMVSFSGASPANKLMPKHKLRSSTPLMSEDSAALQAQLEQLQAQMEILQRQKQIAELQAQLAALQQQGQPSQATISPIAPSPTQVTALQDQGMSIQSNAPAMPSSAQALQELAPQAAKLSQPEVAAASPIDAPQSIESGGDAMTGVADAVVQAEKVVEEGLREIWQQGEEGLSAIFFKDYEVDVPVDLVVWEVSLIGSPLVSLS